MSHTSNLASIEEFLSWMTGSREVGLVVAKDQTELENFAEALNHNSFKKLENISDLLEVQKTYFIANQNTAKDIYDFVVQYPTGQIEIFDKKIMQSRIFFPSYKDSAVVLLVDQDNLNKLQTRGFNFLSASGPAYRS